MQSVAKSCSPLAKDYQCLDQVNIVFGHAYRVDDKVVAKILQPENAADYKALKLAIDSL